MKAILVLILFLMPTGITSDWLNYESEEGGFKVSVPGELKEVKRTVETEIGDINYHSFAYRDNDPNAENLLYTISYSEYPEGSIHSDSTELIKEFLDASVEESVLSVAGKLVYANNSPKQGYPGKLWRVDYGEGAGIIRTHSFVKENRCFTIQTACTKEKSLNEASDKFMKSFRFIKK